VEARRQPVRGERRRRRQPLLGTYIRNETHAHAATSLSLVIDQAMHDLLLYNFLPAVYIRCCVGLESPSFEDDYGPLSLKMGLITCNVN